MMRSWWTITAALCSVLGLLLVIACEASGAKSDKRVKQEPKLSVGQDTGDGGTATSIVFQFVQGNAGGMAGVLGIVVILLLMRRARLNAQVAERLVVAIEKADDGKVKRAVREAAEWGCPRRGKDGVERSVQKIVRCVSAATHRKSAKP